jgi:hypothetical protein
MTRFSSGGVATVTCVPKPPVATLTKGLPFACPTSMIVPGRDKREAHGRDEIEWDSAGTRQVVRRAQRENA